MADLIVYNRTEVGHVSAVKVPQAMDILVSTIITRNRLHLARTLMKSVAVAFPEAKRHVLVVDSPSGYFDPSGEPFEVTLGSEIGLSDFFSYAFVNDPTGLCCLLKPAFALHLLKRTDAEVVIYADGDIVCHSRPAALLRALEVSPVALTPHNLRPPSPGDPFISTEIPHGGVFNAGVFGVRRSPKAAVFLEWWLGAMLRERALFKKNCYDQVYLDHVPVYMPWAWILRDPGCNVAYWNLHERPLARDPRGALTAGGEPVSFFHFSLFDLKYPDLLTRYLPPLAAADPVRGLLHDYVAALRDEGAETCLAWPYAYGFFDDGKPIKPVHRRYYLDRVWNESGRAGSPFDPGFQTRNCKGLKSVYSVDRPATRLVRTLRRLMPRLGA